MMNSEFGDSFIFTLVHTRTLVGGLRGYSRTSVVVVAVAKIRIASQLAPSLPLAEIGAPLPQET